MTAFRNLHTIDGGIITVAANDLQLPKVTSTTRPLSPLVGDVIYETDTFKALQYQSATTGWTPIWNMPWGFIQKAACSGDAAFSAVRDLAGATTANTFVANRRIRVTVEMNISATVATDRLQITISDSANGTWAAITHVPSETTARQWTASFIFVPASGSNTFKLRASRLAGTGTLTVNAETATQPCGITVEDIGPNANPA